MSTFQDYMNRALAANVPDAAVPPPTAPMPTQYQMAANNPSNLAATQLEADIRSLDPYALRMKYGTAADQLIQERNAALQQYQQDTSAGRTFGEGVYDLTSDVGLGAVNMVGGLGSFGLGLVNDNAGVWASEQMSDLNKFVQGTQSEGLNARRRAHDAREKMDERENAALFEEDKANEGELIANLKRIGRDALDTVANVTSDGLILSSGVAQGVGSLGPVGKMSQGALAVAKMLTPAAAKAAAARAASTGRFGDLAASMIANHADDIATTAVLGGVGAGGAYQQTVNEVMEMKHADLMQNSEPYRDLIAQDVLPEDAKKQIAHNAGMRAAGIAAPISLATGAVVSRFERNPLRAPNVSSAVGNVSRETFEEGFQSGGEQLGLNAGVQRYADSSRDLSKGVGTNLGQGALYGLGTASTVQGPGLVTSAVGSGINSAVGAVSDALGKRVDRIQSENEASAPNSMPNIQAEVASVMEADPVAQEAVQAEIDSLDQTDEFKQRVKSYTDNMFSILKLNQADQDTSTGAVQEVFATSPDRLTALDRLADLITSTPDSDMRGQFHAAVALQRVLLDFRSHLESDLDVAEAIDSASPAGQVIERYSDILGKIESNAKVVAAMEMSARVIRKMAEQENQPVVTETSHTTPEGREAMQATAAIAAVEPEKANLASVNMTLAHAQAGRIRLSAAQRQALMVTKGLLESAKQYDQTIKSSGQKPQDIVGTQIKSGTGHKLPSARDHARAVSEAVRTGNRKVAAQALTEMGMFVQHMQNKVDALNQHFAGGTNDPEQSVSYQAVHPESREWYQSPKGMGVNVNSARSVAFAQQVGAEAEFMTNVFNSLVDAFPELQIPKMDQELLDAALVGNPHDVVAAYQAGTMSRPGATTQKAVTPKATPKADPAPQPSAAKTNTVPEEFAELFDEQGRPKFPNAQSVKDFKERTGLGQAGVRAIQAAIQEGRSITVDEARQADLAVQERRKEALEQSKAKAEAEAQEAKQNSAKPAEPSKVLGDYEIPGLEGATNRVRVLQRGERIEAIGLDEGTVNNDLSQLIQSGQTVEQALATLYGDHGPNEAPDPSRVKRVDQPDAASAAKEATKADASVTFKDAYSFDTADTVTSAPPAKVSLNEGQKAAYDAVTAFLEGKEKTFSITGSAGTGKTTIVKEILKSQAAKGFSEVVMSSPTHRANAVTLANNPKARVITLHSLLGLMPSVDLDDFDARNMKFNLDGEKEPDIGANQLIIIDESSMINDALFDVLLKTASEFEGTKILFLGDSAQLPPVKQAHKSKALSSTSGQANLTEVMRAKNATLLDESVAVRKDGDFTKKGEMTGGNGTLFLGSMKNFLQVAIDLFSSERAKSNPLLGRIVAYRNDTVAEYNKRIREKLFPGNTTIAKGDLLMGYASSGDPDRVTGLPLVANGMDYIVESVSPEQKQTIYLGNIPVSLPVLRVKLKDTLGIGEANMVNVISPAITAEQKAELSKAVNQLITEARNNRRLWRSYYDFKKQYVLMENIKDPTKGNVLLAKGLDYGYAHTIHKSQGGTYNYVLVDDTDISTARSKQDREALRYVGLTRAQQGAFVLTNGAVENNVQRADSAQASKQAPEPKLVKDAEPGKAKEQVTKQEPKQEKPPVDPAIPKAAEPKAKPEVKPEPGVDDKVDDKVVNEVDDEATTSAAPTVFTSLKKWAKGGNRFIASFRVPKKQKSRLFGTETPFDLMRYALTDRDTVNEFIGEELPVDYSGVLAKEYESLLNIGDTIKETMEKRLQAFLARGYSKTDPTPLGELMLQGKKPVQTYVSGKFLNITEVVTDAKGNKTIQYNQELLESSILATLQWMLTGQSMASTKGDEDIASILQVANTAAVISGDSSMFNRGLQSAEIVSSLGSKVFDYWGVSKASNGETGFTEGIPMSVAAEILETLLDLNMLTEVKEKFTLMDGDQEITREFNFYTVNENDDDTIYKLPNMLDEMVLLDNRYQIYMGGKIPPVSDAQLRNPVVKNTPEQKATLAKVNNITFKLNKQNIALYDALGEDALVELSGATILEDVPYHVKDKKSLLGRKQGITGAFRELQRVIAQAELYGLDTDIRYTNDFTKVARLQMMGRYTPVSSKLMREALLPTNSTIDVSVPGSEGHSAFYLALAQALGEKVHTHPHSVSFDNVQKNLNTKFAKAIDMLQNWHAEGQQELPASGVQILKEAFGKDFSFVGLHALADYARYLNMSESERKTFNTSMYVEADGVTNGPFNAIALSTTGMFTEHELELLGKGGLWFNEPDQTMNTYRMQDKVDLYTVAAQNSLMWVKNLFASLRSQSKKNREADTLSVGNDIMFLLNHFLDGVSIEEDSAGNGELVVQRNATKNPLTVTVYGSGTQGITNKVVGLLMDTIYERMTLAAQSTDISGKRTEESMARAIFPDAGDPVETYRQFLAALNNVTRRKVVTYKDKNTGEYVSAAMQEYPRGKVPNSDRVSLGPGPVITAINPETFTLTYPAMVLLTANVQNHFTIPMREGINNTLGPTLLENMKMVRFAVQVMSVYASAAFDRGYADLIEKKKKADPDYQPHFGISQEEADQLMQQYRFAMPLINTGPQEYYITGKDRTTVSRSMATSGSGKFSVPGTIMAPSNAGVKASASLNIGLGDAFAMQRTILGISGNVAGLPVFDGFNMALDKLQDYSDKANMGVLQSLEQNPFKSVLETYRQFMEVAPKPDAVIVEKFFEGSGQVFDLDEVMKMTLEKLTEASANADARIAVRKSLAKSVDQMASVGQAHVTSGIEVVGTLSEKAEQMNALLDAQTKADAPTPATKAVNFGRTLKSGVTLLLMRSFKKGYRSDAYPWGNLHKEVMDALVDSGNLDDYQVVSGTKTQILEYIKQNRKQAPNGIDLDNAFGWMNPVDKVVYLVSGSKTETLVHELVHASTFETLISHYSGKLSGDQAKTVKLAVDNIEQLMAQFLNMEDSFVNLSYQTQTAYENAVAAIKGYLGNSDMDPALSKASALNEFMAWTLANKKLASVTKNVKANPIVAFTKKALELIKTLIFGGKGMPKVGDDLYSNLLFNTSILSRISPTADSMMFGSLSHNVPPAMNERLTKIREAFNAHVGRWLNTDFTTQGFRKTEVTDAIASAMSIVQSVITHGFSMSSSEQATMQAVVAALATGVKLNNTALIRAQGLFDHVMKNLKPEHFLDDPNTTDPNELFAANEKFNVIQGNYSVPADKYGRTGLLPTFLGLALVNEDMRNALNKLSVPAKEKASFDSLNESLQSAGNMVMDKLVDTLSGKAGDNTNVRAAVDALTNHIMATMVEEHTIADLTANKVNGLLGSANEYVKEGLESLASKASNKATAMDKQGASRMKRLAAQALRAAAAIASEKEGAVVAEGVISVTNQLKMGKTYAAMVAELIGRTLSNAALYDMIKVFRMRNQQTRQKYREDVPRIISTKFSRTLTDHEWGAMFRGLAKTDLAALRQTMSIDEILTLVSDKKALKAKITELETSLQKASPNWALHQKKMKQLSNFMITGNAGTNLLRNAYTTAHLFNEGVPTPKVDKAFEAGVDQLVSLYAFQNLPQSDQAALASLVQTEANGMSFSMSYLEGQRKDELARIAGAAVTNHFKGYTPSLQQEGVSLRVAENAEHASLLARSHKRIGTYTGSSIDRYGRNRGYYFAPVNSKTAFNQGLMQTVHQTAYGVNVATGFSSGVLTAGPITDKAEVQSLAMRMRYEKATNESLMPVLNEQGNIIAFERSVDPAMLTHLNQDQHFARMVGVWRGRQVEEYEGRILNDELVKKAHEMWTAEKKTRGGEYVNLFDKNLKDPVLADAVSLITFETRETIEKLFGKDKFMVRADLIDNVVGYRMPSIADAWTGNTRWGKEVQETTKRVLMGFMGNKAYQYTVNGEKDIQDLVQQAKLMIVIKSVIVGGANIVSNVLQLASLNVPLNKIVREVPKKLAEVHFYQEKQIRRIEAEAELRAAVNDPRVSRRLSNEIQAIDDSIKRLSIWPLIEAGEFSSIADAGISRDDLKLTSGRVAEFVEGVVSKLPEKVQIAGKYALITRDTAIFQGLQKMVQYGDFVAKAIMYDDLTERQKLDPTEVKGRVSEEFVNYEWLPGRFRSYVESMGMMWFWHFKVRSVKVGLNLMRRNPVSALLSLAIPNMMGANIGSPITDNIFSVAADGRLGYSLGPGQGLNAPALHPFF